jgi:hypothetical protein
MCFRFSKLCVCLKINFMTVGDNSEGTFGN